MKVNYDIPASGKTYKAINWVIKGRKGAKNKRLLIVNNKTRAKHLIEGRLLENEVMDYKTYLESNIQGKKLWIDTTELILLTLFDKGKIIGINVCKV